MKLLSLFDGSGGFPLAGAMCGFVPAYASEIEPYPIAVTKSRFPNMVHLGDVTKINGTEIEPCDVVCFGFPCQDVSVAGKRKGVKHEDNGDDETTRSGLVWEAIRIIEEMRGATNGKYPKFAVFENVPGLFSSEKGETFRTVIEGLIKIVEPNAVMPEVPKKGWAYADSYVGNGWSFAYRIFDAQYIRTAQRRRRVYAVLDLGGQRARQILFEREGLRGYFTESGTPWQGITTDAQRSVGADDSHREGEAFDGYNASVSNKAATLGVNCGFSTGRNGVVELRRGRGPNAVNDNILDDQGGQQINVRTDGKSPTIRAETHGNLPCVMEPMTIRCKGNTEHTHRVVYAIDQGGGKSGANVSEGVTPTLCTTHGGEPAVSYEKLRRYIVRRLTPTECARLQGFPDTWGHIEHKDDFTDEEYKFWLNVRNTHAEINGKAVKDYTKKQMLTWYNKLHNDGNEYKMWGNGIALPCALFVMEGIADALKDTTP